VRIFEITDKNKTWNAISGISTNYEEEYTLLLRVHDLYTKMKRHHQYPAIVSQMDDFITDATKFVNVVYPDKNDPDIDNIKNNTKQMISHIEQLRTTLL